MNVTYNYVPHQPETWTYRYALTRRKVEFSKFLGSWENGKPLMETRIVPRGTKVKIVMVSRFGDVGITDDLTAETGYQARIDPDDLDFVKE